MAPSVREMAQRFNAAVTVLNACNLAPEYISGPAPDAPCDSQERPTFFSPALQEMRNQQQLRLEGFAYTHFADIGHTERIEIGEPAAVIEWVAKCEGIDLIMMPTRSLRNEQYRVTIYIWATNPRRLVRTYFSRH